MRWLRLLLLLFLASCCFAQDGISPDTIYTFAVGNYLYDGITNWPWCADTETQPQDSCVYFGDCVPNAGGCRHLSGEYHFSSGISASSSKTPFVFVCRRGYALFNTVSEPDLSTMEVFDSVQVSFYLQSYTIEDGDSLFIVQFMPGEVNSPWFKSYSNLDDLCNFYKCGLPDTSIWRYDEQYYYGKGGVDLSVGWNTVTIDTSFINEGDSSGIGFLTRKNCESDKSYDPTGINNYTFGSVDSVGIIYYYSPRYNDISHQDNADGISPDTIQFICSGATDSIKTPGYWRTEWLGDWNLDPNHGSHDAFHGRYRSDVTGCDTGYCASLWNYAMQPWVRAWKRPVFNDYQMTRAYFLLELEEPIPSATELDSMRFYMQFADVNVKDGDSLHVVTYEPRHSIDGSDSCYVCYGCKYPALITPTGAWCNFWECGPNAIWGTRTASVPGRVPVYLGWEWFPIHPDIIDFTEASVGDTFGVGLVLRFEDSPAPTDTNKADIMTDPCPYIVYWFSEPPPDTTAGFINWGLSPPHLNWGLPLNQPRRAWGGSRKP